MSESIVSHANAGQIYISAFPEVLPGDTDGIDLIYVWTSQVCSLVGSVRRETSGVTGCPYQNTWMTRYFIRARMVSPLFAPLGLTGVSRLLRLGLDHGCEGTGDLVQAKILPVCLFKSVYNRADREGPIPEESD